MKKMFFLLVTLVALGIGFGTGSFYQCSKSKVAIVDIQAIVGKSQQVQNLQAEQAAKAQEVTEWLKNAQSDVNGESDEEKQKDLLKKYNEEFAAKRDEIQRQYAEKLKAVDEYITRTISDEAQKNGYKLVMPKGFIIYGGEDITEEIAKIVK